MFFKSTFQSRDFGEYYEGPIKISERICVFLVIQISDKLYPDRLFTTLKKES